MVNSPPKPPPSPPLKRALDEARRFWERRDLRDWFGGMERMALGVSGGCDSVALLWLLAAPEVERPAWAPEILAAHVNHGLRGEESDADQARVAALARRLGVAFRYRTLNGDDLRKKAKKSGSLEEAARRERYGALREIVRRSDCEGLVLAHHQDDLAETFLMRLLRGSGLTGLGGFGPRSELMGLRLVRPLVDWPREAVRALARDAGLEWGEDSSNRDPAFMRNRVRHRILPFLERESDHPPVGRMLAKTARRLEREGRALGSYVEGLYKRHRLERSAPRRLGLPLSALTEGDAKVFAPYLLRFLLMDLLESPYPPSESRIGEIQDLAESGAAGSLLQTAQSVVVWKSPEGEIWAYRKTKRRISREALLKIFRKS